MAAEYNPNNEGWGFAGVVVVLTGGLLFGAFSIHERTYVHPRDPMAQQVYHERDVAKAAEHKTEGAAEHKTEGAAELKGEAKPESAAAEPKAEKH